MLRAAAISAERSHQAVHLRHVPERNGTERDARQVLDILLRPAGGAQDMVDGRVDLVVVVTERLLCLIRELAEDPYDIRLVVPAGRVGARSEGVSAGAAVACGGARGGSGGGGAHSQLVWKQIVSKANLVEVDSVVDERGAADGNAILLAAAVHNVVPEPNRRVSMRSHQRVQRVHRDEALLRLIVCIRFGVAADRAEVVLGLAAGRCPAHEMIGVEGLQEPRAGLALRRNAELAGFLRV